MLMFNHSLKRKIKYYRDNNKNNDSNGKIISIELLIK